jgi:hypothetical protein
MSMLDVTTSKPAQQVSRTGGFELSCSADNAFPLFSPEGERLWIKEWDPRPIYPGTIEFKPDVVFRQGKGAEDAVWTVVDIDWETHRAEYVRTAPLSHTAHIVVRIDAIAAERCHVTVRYVVTAFAEYSCSLLEAFSEDAYDAKMRNWGKLIGEYLATAA